MFLPSVQKSRSAFTLIEMLVVIAIIAILAAILFPVISRAREQARESTCMSNMHDIYVALRLYETDNHLYPPVLWQFAGISGYKPLFGAKLLNSDATFSCPDNPTNNQTLTVNQVVYPATASSTLANQPVVYTPLMQHNAGNAVTLPVGTAASYYPFDSYDIGPQLDSNGNPVRNAGGYVYELHYSLDWTGASGPGDAPNQLKYAETANPSQTVITWCTYHAAVNGVDKTLVIFLNGTAKAVDAKTFAQKGPLKFAQ
ncbi:prepilin-type N-terminal cleavage/methylation domain-containing protein [Chthonomonas calidirosea]|uniref:Prepilin-type N-terminal cleavage/methylation domain n=1 Tax=Chthonomonas calidirosea (strain DSM 23976 / ICMP 18418 / T49) TaxID=1303518 RepID=S0ETU7_CHTCT|nr:prepilin-type N-terminal cleavage/methylation domain-containing protein [Chthonomonas calidirosea]CCW35006.1 prepilin-type N-terminal cleavage/methylation domain [Chthonomonas calidirosea T49]CEK20979.1 prepilin-type N-terminal cleavage/methylation domain-containing protein [Chthonomonas calidirosea]